MKVLLLNGSAHLQGCTFTALSEVAKTLNEQGVETEIFQLGNPELKDCSGCGACSTAESTECGIVRCGGGGSSKSGSGTAGGSPESGRRSRKTSCKCGKRTEHGGHLLGRNAERIFRIIILILEFRLGFDGGEFQRRIGTDGGKLCDAVCRQSLCIWG